MRPIATDVEWYVCGCVSVRLLNTIIAVLKRLNQSGGRLRCGLVFRFLSRIKLRLETTNVFRIVGPFHAYTEQVPQQTDSQRPHRS